MVEKLTEAILVPCPLSVHDAPGLFLVGPQTRVSEGDPGTRGVADAVAGDLLETSGGRPSASRIELRAEGIREVSPEAYTITITPDILTIAAEGARGLFLGRATLRQLLIQSGGAIPCGEISDAPAFAHRGYMLDVSRNKVPAMDTLLAWIDLLAHFKYNHFQLYIEHAFAYINHEVSWENASPFTAEEIRRIDAYCRERFIEFVPNQNSLGHMEQWLKHSEYAHLAECPEGFQDPWTPDWRTPSTLSPVLPGSLDLVAELHAELLPNFSSGLFNVGCDEPFELGQGLSRKACEHRGKGRVYLEWLLKLRKLHGRHRLLFWADIINEHPELVAELPKEMIPLEWGYEAGHPWDARCARFAEAGLQFFVCPGTSSWNAITGRTENALSNIEEAAAAGLRHRAMGFLVTEWGDLGHRQFLPINHLPMAAGAACAWNPAGFDRSVLPRAVENFILSDAAGKVGQWLWDFGNLYLCDPSPPLNHSRFYMLLHHRDGRTSAGYLPASTFSVALAKLDALELQLEGVRMQCHDADLVHDELALSLSFLKHACRRGLALKAGREKESSTHLAAELAPLIGRYREIWVRRNRPGGLDDSVRLLHDLLAYYRNGG